MSPSLASLRAWSDKLASFVQHRMGDGGLDWGLGGVRTERRDLTGPPRVATRRREEAAGSPLLVGPALWSLVWFPFPWQVKRLSKALRASVMDLVWYRPFIPSV